MSPDCLGDRRDHRQQLMLVVRLLRHRLAHDQLQPVDRDLRVVALDESIGPLHDPRLRIREVVLRLRVRFRRVWRLARGGGLGLRAGLQRPFGLADPRQATLAPLQFRGQFIALLIRPVHRVLGRIRRLGLRQQLAHLVPQLPLFLWHASVTHRLVLRGVRLDLRAVEGHATDPRGAQLARPAAAPARRSPATPPDAACENPRSCGGPARCPRPARETPRPRPTVGASCGTRTRRHSTRRRAASSSSPGGTADTRARPARTRS